MTTPLKIVELRAENVKRLKAVSIRPDGSLVIIGGQNGAGKSSTLDAIWYALGGTRSLPPMPVREGATEAVITLDLGDFIVVRTITPDGKSTLKVTGKDGGKYASPQSILDAMIGNLSFDPLAFSRMEPRKQLDTLKGLVGLDFSAIDRQKAAKTEERTFLGREVKQLQGQLAGMPQHASAPEAEVSMADLTKKLGEARAANQKVAQVQTSLKEAAKAKDLWAAKIEALEKELADARQQASRWADILQQKQQEAASTKQVDEQSIIDKLSTAEATNRQVRENRDRAAIEKKLREKEAGYEALTLQIQGFDEDKGSALAAAKFPVAGLSFDESGVLVNEIPFQQASAAEQMKVSVAMGFALNPKLKVLLVRDGSLLDEKSMALMAQMAEQSGGQLWLERVGDGDEKAVIIEDGEVRGHAAVAERPAA